VLPMAVQPEGLAFDWQIEGLADKVEVARCQRGSCGYPLVAYSLFGQKERELRPNIRNRLCSSRHLPREQHTHWPCEEFRQAKIGDRFPSPR